MYSFIHFGCWNQGECQLNTDNNPLSTVMTNLNKYCEINNPNFITVAGDNYYPKKYKDKGKDKSSKKNKVKIINSDDMLSGFQCLPNNIDIFMLLGNHDLETNNDKNILFIDNKENPENNCYILNNELDFSLMHEPPINFVFNNSIILDNTLIIMIDTSMYEKNSDKYLKCYSKLLNYNFKTIEELYLIQYKYVLNTITSNIDKYSNLVIIGHHPITGIKEKDNNVDLIKVSKQFIILLNSIYVVLGDDINYYYLCADLHLHQEGEVIINNIDGIMVINQYIIGTGGTKLDDNPSYDINQKYNKHISIEDNDVFYNMNISEKKFGFLECKEINGNLSFKFIDS